MLIQNDEFDRVARLSRRIAGGADQQRIGLREQAKTLLELALSNYERNASSR